MMTLGLQVLVSCLASTHAAPESASIVAGGDVMLDRGVRVQIEKHGPRALFSSIAPLLRAADFAFANLECPLARFAPKIARPPAFKADPALAPALKNAGFDVLSLANNHALDCGPRGLGETLDALQKASLQPIGAARTSQQLAQPIVTSAHGVRIAWIGLTQFAPPQVEHVQDAIGPALRPWMQPLVARLDDASLRTQVRRARAVADVVVLSLHWGVEYQAAPTRQQRLWARAALDAGADVILGHHPHVVGPIEEVRLGGRRRLVAYSLGNLVFDARSWNRRANQSVLLRIEVGAGGLRSWSTLPLKILNCRPAPTIWHKYL